MSRTALLSFCFATMAAAGCGTPPAERGVLDQVAQALGGRDAVLGAGAVTLEGTATQWNLGQDLLPDAHDQTFTLEKYTHTVTGDGTRARLSATRTPNFPYYQGQAPQAQVTGLDGSVAYRLAANGTGRRLGEDAAREERAAVYRHPLPLVQAALKGTAQVGSPRSEAGGQAVDVTVDGLVVTLGVDATGRPRYARTRSAHPNLGDVAVETAFADYTTVGPLQLPATLTTRVDRFVTEEVKLTAQRLGEASAVPAAPADVETAAAPAPAPPTVEAEMLAPGVWLLAGGSHHSALIALGDHLVLVDAPDSEARTLAVIEQAKALVPGKPLTTLVMTHHHFDHTAGLRAAIAAGMRVVTQARNTAFVEQMAGRPHTLRPDALAKAPANVKVEHVDDVRDIGDTARPLSLIHLADNPHASAMLAVHLPKEKLLIQVDAFSPGAATNPYAANLLEHVRRRSLAVDRIVPLHGKVVPFAELEKVVTATAGTQ